MTEAVLQSLTGKERANNCLHNRELSVQGKTLRCSSHVIEQDNREIGLLCISFDDSRFRALSTELLRLCHPDSFAPFEQLAAGTHLSAAGQAPDMASAHSSIEAIKQILAQYGLAADRLTADERMQIIQALKAGGTFQIKGAVRDAARMLHCSQASIYRYISQSAKT